MISRGTKHLSRRLPADGGQPRPCVGECYFAKVMVWANRGELIDKIGGGFCATSFSLFSGRAVRKTERPQTVARLPMGGPQLLAPAQGTRALQDRADRAPCPGRIMSGRGRSLPAATHREAAVAPV